MRYNFCATHKPNLDFEDFIICLQAPCTLYDFDPSGQLWDLNPGGYYKDIIPIAVTRANYNLLEQPKAVRANYSVRHSYRDYAL